MLSAVENINRELAKQGLPAAKMLEGPKFDLNNNLKMDPVLAMFITVGVPIIAVGIVCSCFFWIRLWLNMSTFKRGQDKMEEVILKRLPMPTVEEVGEDIIQERELQKKKDLIESASIEERVLYQYEKEEVAKNRKKRGRVSANDTIAYNLDDFQYRDAVNEMPDAVVSAFLTTGKFEAKSDVKEEVDMQRTFQRLKDLQVKVDNVEYEDNPSYAQDVTTALWGDVEKTKELLKSANRAPRSKSRPLSVTGVMPIVEGSTTRKQQVAAQHNTVSAFVGKTMPAFLNDQQVRYLLEHPEPVKLGRRIEEAAAKGPREDQVLRLENGDANGSTHANGSTLSKKLLQVFTSGSSRNKHEDEGVEVTV